MDLLIPPRWLFVVVLAFVFGPAGNVRAQLSPGPLHQSHEALEGVARCTQCHALGKGVERERCLTCHEPLRARITERRGLHARPGYENCIACHSDHHGRDYAMIRWPGEQRDFAHTETGYELRLAHAKLECRGCHQSRYVTDRDALREHDVDLDRTFLGLGTACRDCHEDEHASTLGDDCTRCHDEGAWKPAPKFDHAKSEYPLVGKHAEVPCAKCHPTSPRFAQLVFDQCTDCHKDPHSGDLGTDCARCHQPWSWAQVTTGAFDHDTTKFPLVGAHRSVTCARCHVSGRSITGRLFCDQCHEDVHRKRFVDASTGRTDCTRCHTAERFVPATYGFREHDVSRYPLTGAHLAVPCTDCHRSGAEAVYVWPSLDCGSCHADAHAGSFRASLPTAEPCGVCHRTEAWDVVAFAHETSGYRLEGAHAEASCVACHAAPVREAVRNWDLGTAGPTFASLAAATATETAAAETEAFVALRTEAAAQRFAVRAGAAAERAATALRAGAGRASLRGTKAGATPEGRGARSPAAASGGKAGAMTTAASLLLDDTPLACAACHLDPHGDQFAYLVAELPVEEGIDPGAALCARCHDTVSWTAGRFDHERDARYSLKGAHEKVACGECHRREADGLQRFRPLGTECRDCHATPPRSER